MRLIRHRKRVRRARPTSRLALVLGASIALSGVARTVPVHGADIAVAINAPPTVSSTIPYGLPVAGPIIDPYRPPSNPYGPGNRGIDFATTPGAPVGAPADGDVVFAGQVGRDLFVVIRHADGVRTTLGFLATILVGAGQHVHAGQWVGTSGASVHFGARVGAVYIDPMSLLAPQMPKVWLIPTRR